MVEEEEQEWVHFNVVFKVLINTSSRRNFTLYYLQHNVCLIFGNLLFTFTFPL